PGGTTCRGTGPSGGAAPGGGAARAGWRCGPGRGRSAPRPARGLGPGPAPGDTAGRGATVPALGLARLLAATRGEIAIRVCRAAEALGLATVAVAPGDDAASLHLRRADAAHTLPGRGAAAYLDVAAVVEAAVATGCDALHPGYGFLSERADLAR